MTSKPLRSDEEAWRLALDNRGLVYKVLLAFVYSHNHDRYDLAARQAELESHAWEGMLKACRAWDPARGRLSTLAVLAVRRQLYKAWNNVIRQGGIWRNVEAGRAYPYVDSLDRPVGQSGEVTLQDALAGTWPEDTGSWEDEVGDRVDSEREHERLLRVVRMMDDEHREVYLSYLEALSPLLKAHDLGVGRGRGERLVRMEARRRVREALGLTANTTARLIREGEEFVRWHTKTT